MMSGEGTLTLELPTSCIGGRAERCLVFLVFEDIAFLAGARRGREATAEMERPRKAEMKRGFEKKKERSKRQ